MNRNQMKKNFNKNLDKVHNTIKNGVNSKKSGNKRKITIKIKKK